MVLKRYLTKIIFVLGICFGYLSADNIYSDRPSHTTADSGLLIRNASRLDISNQYTNEDGFIFHAGKSTITSSTSGGGINFRNGLYLSEEKLLSSSANAVNNRETYIPLSNKLFGFYDINQGGKFILPTGPGSWHVDNDAAILDGHIKFPAGYGLPTLAYGKNMISVRGILEGQIDLTGVHLKLMGDLELRGDDTIGITGSALTTLDLSGHKLKIAGRTLFSDTTSAVSFNQGITFIAPDVGVGGMLDGTASLMHTAGTIELGTRINLNSTWSFYATEGNAAFGNNLPRTHVIIEGNGNVLDLSGGGVLAVGPQGALTLRNLYIKGFQTSSLTFATTSSYIRLCNVTLELGGNATFGNSSNIYIDGPMMFVTKNFSLTLSSTTANNGSWLFYYDTQGVAANNNLTGGTAVAATQLVTSNSNIATLQGQMTTANSNISSLQSLTTTATNDISSLQSLTTTATTNVATLQGQMTAANSNISSLLVPMGIGAPFDIVFSTNTTATFDYFLSDIHRMVFSANCVLDGGGHRITLSNAKVGQLVVDPGVTVSLKNFVIDNFSDSHLSLGLGSSFSFADNCVVNVYPNDTWTQALTFGQNTILCGKSGALTLGVTASIISTNAIGLRIKDITLKGITNNNIACSSNSAQIIFDNVVMNLSGNFTFGTGTFSVDNHLRIFGPYIFIYNSSVASQINSSAEIIFDKGASFRYYPSVANSSLITMVDKTSRLHMVNTTLDVTQTGLQLINGTFVVDGQLDLTSAATLANQAISFGNGIEANELTVELLSGGNLNLSRGILNYQNLENRTILAMGNVLLLQHKNYGYFLGFAVNTYSSVSIPGAPSAVVGISNISDPRTKFSLRSYTTSGGANYSETTSLLTQYLAGSTTNNGNIMLTNEYIQNSLAGAENTKTSKLALTDNTYAAPVSTPKPPYYALYAKNDNTNTFALFKKVGNLAQSQAYNSVIREGDTVYISGSSTLGNYVVYGTNNAVSIGGESFYEVAGYYNASPTITGDGNEEWILYKVNP